MDNVDLKKLYDDYKKKFHNNSCMIETNYKKLNEFIVKFNILDLHHLFGIHKLENINASKTKEFLEKNELDLNKYRKYKNFNEVVNRINNYNFISEIFIDKKYNYCILAKDLNKNTMKLSVVFYKENEDKYIVFGLRKIYKNVFVPTTLHEGRGQAIYKSYRQTKIKNIKWLD
ncbi:hypothetical protein HMPREF1983_00915 [Gemella bergeri ATCC 700627]|uniref:Phage-Barnase-EndoU-ColicinE5/D-RelE like nuclease 4 domain-containing protein n=1 Tax=Gemella bergeri ATCC 700627 TaxID=1321820 RepID=U2S4U7_9BACL|nr:MULTISPECIES: PBECR4 domain-containing protein [Gemella]AME09652.1 hypothetical protein AXE85_05555 [Gemella sp. oral taxon 928]AXI27253.1 hypothetical protein CG018_07480 [Gemella sp. ND 6198]ERK57812.1 hypothetical protein HMPREF1983_00915 [Gemella bergeri ATCC 700627]